MGIAGPEPTIREQFVEAFRDLGPDASFHDVDAYFQERFGQRAAKSTYYAIRVDARKLISMNKLLGQNQPSEEIPSPATSSSLLEKTTSKNVVELVQAARLLIDRLGAQEAIDLIRALS